MKATKLDTSGVFDPVKVRAHELELALPAHTVHLTKNGVEFLSDQVHGLRRAFSTLSDVLIEEVDLIRTEAAERQDEVCC